MSNKIEKKVFDEEWSRWQPNSLVKEGHYYIDEFSYGEDGFKIMLSDEDNSQIVEVLFDGEVSGARFADEGMRLQLYSDLADKYGADFYPLWTFFKVKNSDFLKWLSVQSCEISDFYKLEHFVIMCSNSMLEIAVSYEPEVRVLPSVDLDKKFKSKIIMTGTGFNNYRNYSKNGQSVLENFEGNISIKKRGLDL